MPARVGDIVFMTEAKMTLDLRGLCKTSDFSI